MARLIIVGSSIATEKFCDNYIKENGFYPYEVQRFSEKVKVEEVRNIRKVLALKVKRKLLFVLSGDISVECQNALLKNIEEAEDAVHFIFCVDSVEKMLPTVRSRCREVLLSEVAEINTPLYNAVRELAASKDPWKSIDEITDLTSQYGMESLAVTLRTLLIDGIEDSKNASHYHMYCKRLLSHSHLSGRNNVNGKIIIEKIFGLPL